MSFSLINNLGSLESQSRLGATGFRLNQTIQHLSSGLRINSSGDDAAGLSIANKYRSDIAVLNQGVRNANDGLSGLQIIDGGLNTISNLLDRAATLASQSASDTFTGNRETLQGEFTKVLGEITRQAQNIGLVSNGANNQALTTIIGGGSDAFSSASTNNGVQIDLSGTANQVDATGLGLSGLNIGQAQGSVTGAAAITALGATETLTFRVANSAGTLTTFNVALTSGFTGTEVVDAINADTNIQDNGITASLDSTGALKLTSSNFFTVESDTAAAAGTTTSIDVDEVVSSAATTTTLTAAASTTAGTQAFDFTIGSSGAIVRVNVTGGNEAANVNAADIITAVNANTTLRDAGIYAISVDDAASVQIVSTKNNFQLNVEAATVSTAAVVTNTVGSQTITAGTAGGGADGAKSALDALADAVAALGAVQGVVGAGQNRLLQAIDLATSQITNFQSAESRIRDADVTAEASNLSRLSVLQQAGVAALAQANQSTQAVLSLLR